MTKKKENQICRWEIDDLSYAIWFESPPLLGFPQETSNLACKIQNFYQTLPGQTIKL